MKTLLLVYLGLIYLIVFGIGLSALLFNSPKKQLIAAPFLCYAAVQLFFGTSILSGFGSDLSFYLAVLVPVVLTFIAFKSINVYIEYVVSVLKPLLLHFFVVTVIILITAWPMLYFDSINSYYHSGALDLVQDVFVKSLTIYRTGEYKSIYGDERYVLSHVLQYTSPAFWFHFFGVQSISIVLIQYLVLLSLMYAGLYYWLRELVNQSRGSAICIAFFSCCSTFYVTSFVNYHAGTMMILALCFFMLFLFDEIEKSEKKSKKIALVTSFALLSIYCLLAYNYAIYIVYFIGLLSSSKFLLPKIRILVAHLNLTKKAIVAIFIGIFTMLLLIIYFITVNNDTFYITNLNPFAWNLPGYRPWKLMRSEAALLFYWGLIPSLIMGEGYLLFDKIYGFPILYYSLQFLAVFLTILTIQGVMIVSKNNAYLRATYLFIIAILPVFFLFLDPYYTYKILYTTQPLFILALVVKYNSMGLASLSCYRNLYYRKFVSLIIIILLIGNVITNAIENRSIISREYNSKPEIVNNISNVPSDILNNARLHMSPERYWLYMAHLFKSERMPLSAQVNQFKYLIFDSNDADISIYPDSGPLAQYGSISVFPAGNYILVDEQYHNIEKDVSIVGTRPVRVIYDRHTLDEISGRPTIDYSIKFTGNNSSERYKYIQIGIIPELSVNYKPLTLKYRLNGQYGTIDVKGNDILYIPVSGLQKINLKLWYEGEAVVDIWPLDQRKLIAKIFDIRLVEEKFEIDALRLLNPELSPSARNSVVFGNGWYGIESKTFRWGANDLEVGIFNASEKGRHTLDIDLEPGPSLDLPISIDLLDSDMNLIGRVNNIDKRTNVNFDLNIPDVASVKYFSLFLRVSKSTIPLSADPRDLSLRVFSMKIH